MKNEIADLDRIIADYGDIFDKVYVTVTHRDTYDQILKKSKDDKRFNVVEFSFFEWSDHFGKARLYNQKQITTDYWMWIDLDDEIVGAKHIRGKVQDMATRNIDVTWLQYDYVPRQSASDSGSISWRERIIKNAPNLAWRNVPVHETLDESIQGNITEEFYENIIIKHRKTAEQFRESEIRNKKILEKDWRNSPTASTAFYLGKILRNENKYDDAIEKLSFAAAHSDIRPLRFESLQIISDCYLQLHEYENALLATDQCASIDTDHPAPWFQRFSIYSAVNKYDKALQAGEIALRKPRDGSQGLILTWDPTLYDYKFPFMMAQIYLSVGNNERAYGLYKAVKATCPEYIQEQSTKENQWDQIFNDAHANMRPTS